MKIFFIRKFPFVFGVLIASSILNISNVFSASLEDDCELKNKMLSSAIDFSQKSSVSLNNDTLFNEKWTKIINASFCARGRDLSQPAFLTEMALSYDLVGKKLSAVNQNLFCSAVLFRTYKMLKDARVFSFENESNSPSFTEKELYNNPSLLKKDKYNRSNIFIREAAGLLASSLMLEKINKVLPNVTCALKETGEVIDIGAVAQSFEIVSSESLSLAFKPEKSSQRANEYYRLIAEDGTWKEGQGYMRFAYETIAPLAYIYPDYRPNIIDNNKTHKNTKGTIDSMREAMKLGLTWLAASQKMDGTWASQNDSATVMSGESVFAVAFAALINNDFTISLKDKNAWCLMLEKNNSRRNFITGLDVCSIPKSKPSESIRTFQSGGQIYLSSSKNSLEAQLLNEGAWWNPKKEQDKFSADRECSIPNMHASIKDRTEKTRCEFENNIFKFFSPKGEFSPRFDNHKRFNDTHLQLAKDGDWLVIGPGKMGYLSDISTTDKSPTIGLPYPYEEWNKPELYNMTKVDGAFPKTLFAPDSAKPKVRIVKEFGSNNTLSALETDSYTRYVLWGRGSYMVVFDLFNNTSPVDSATRVNFRSYQAANRLDPKSGFQDYFFPLVEVEEKNKPIQLNEIKQGRGVLFFPLLDDNKSKLVIDHSGRDSCMDDDYKKHEVNGYCVHDTAILKTSNKHPQLGTGYLLWPTSANYKNTSGPTVIREFSKDANNKLIIKLTVKYIFLKNAFCDEYEIKMSKVGQTENPMKFKSCSK